MDGFFFRLFYYSPFFNNFRKFYGGGGRGDGIIYSMHPLIMVTSTCLPLVRHQGGLGGRIYTPAYFFTFRIDIPVIGVAVITLRLVPELKQQFGV